MEKIPKYKKLNSNKYKKKLWEERVAGNLINVNFVSWQFMGYFWLYYSVVTFPHHIIFNNGYVTHNTYNGKEMQIKC